MKNKNDLLKMLVVGCMVSLVAACSDDDKSGDEQPGGTGNPVTSIILSNVTDERVILNDVGASLALQVAANPTDAGDVEKYYYAFTSSDPQVFTVSNTGVITATGYGEAALSVIARNNTDISAKCKVVVAGTKVTSVALADNYRNVSVTRDGDYPTIDIGTHVTVSPANASVRKLKYTTSDQNVAIADEYGVITAIGKGAAVIKIEAADGSGKFAECTVNVGQYEYRLLDRSSWTAIDSSPTIAVTTGEFTSGGPEYAIDGTDKVVGLLKPGAVGGPTDGVLYFTFDMGQAKEFNYYTVSGTWAGSVNNAVKINRLSIYGSDDNRNFLPLQENIAVPTNVYDSSVNLNATHNYRYVKIAVAPSSALLTVADYVIIKDFKLGNRIRTN